MIDEADLMADLGFLPAVQRLLDQTPSQGQRLLFSATLDRAIDALVRRYLTDPVTHAVDAVYEAPVELDPSRARGDARRQAGDRARARLGP